MDKKCTMYNGKKEKALVPESLFEQIILSSVHYTSCTGILQKLIMQC